MKPQWTILKFVYKNDYKYTCNKFNPKYDMEFCHIALPMAY